MKDRITLLIVDDEPSIRKTLKIALEREGYKVESACNGPEALQIAKKINIDVLITDLRMAGMDGIELMETMKDTQSNFETIVISAYADIKKAVESIKLGAFDYLQKNFSIDELVVTVKKAVERKQLLEENRILRQKLNSRYRFEDIVGKSDRIVALYKLIEKIAPSKANVLIMGESGTGKEVFAKAIHKKSDRRFKPFVAINCAALPENLLESELFGHEKGSFTGAISQKNGKFEQADGGTIFLDEIGELSSVLQAKMLRFLQEREFERVGGLDKIKVNVRIISATNKDLEKAMLSGKFRDDLYYRLNVVSFRIPPLRERKEDIPLLSQYFLNQYNIEYNKSINLISVDTIEYLMAYNWPGNVRELKNTIERAVAIADEMDDIILPRHLPLNILGVDNCRKEEQKEILTLMECEKYHIVNTLKKVDGNKTTAAKLLNINRQTLYNKIKQYNIDI
jgi:DNA-binding NtrC family response regulator